MKTCRYLVERPNSVLGLLSFFECTMKADKALLEPMAEEAREALGKGVIAPTTECHYAGLDSCQLCPRWSPY